jgi:hypothetical protein
MTPPVRAFTDVVYSATILGHDAEHRAIPIPRWTPSPVRLDTPAEGRLAGRADYLAQLCRETPTRPGDPPVRIPGERALALKRRQLAEGVAVSPLILPALELWALKLGVAVPAALGD